MGISGVSFDPSRWASQSTRFIPTNSKNLVLPGWVRAWPHPLGWRTYLSGWHSQECQQLGNATVKLISWVLGVTASGVWYWVLGMKRKNWWISKILGNPLADAMADQWRDCFLGTNLLILGRTPGNNTRGASWDRCHVWHPWTATMWSHKGRGLSSSLNNWMRIFPW